MPQDLPHRPLPDWYADRMGVCKHFLRDMEELWTSLMRLAAIVEDSLNNSVHALCDSRADLAAAVKGEERSVNTREVQIEHDCLRILALHQPVASDLRRVAITLKINGDLERMADLALHIAKRVRKMTRDSTSPPIPPAMESMAMEVLGQVRDTLDALAKSDVALARSVIQGDRAIDRQYHALLKAFKQSIRFDPERVDAWLRLINTARNLERIADHATNIAESVIYLMEGDIVRHVHTAHGLRP